MWCVAVTVDVHGATTQGQREGLERKVVPAVRQQPGFRSGTWAMRDDERAGLALVVFETEDDARAYAATETVGGHAGPGATITSVHVHEVLAHAEELVAG